MGRQIAAACALIALLCGALVGPAAAQDDIEYLGAVELLYDPDTDALIDPDTGTEVTHPRFTTDDILDFQDRVEDVVGGSSTSRIGSTPTTGTSRSSSPRRP